jgi:hypothetical protein
LAALNWTTGCGTASIKLTVFFPELASNALVAAKVAVSGYDPGAAAGVTEHDAAPAPFVVAVQV